MKVKFRYSYILILILTLVISSISATYAYFAASSSSSSNAIETEAGSYNMSMQINSLYEGASIIPMDDSNVIKALNNRCYDKYNRSVCYAYTININGYDDSLGSISGSMNVTTNNITNLSYLMFVETNSDINDENCVNINGSYYCRSIDVGKVTAFQEVSLGDDYNIVGTVEKKLLLVIWLTNLEESQNDYDIGDFSADVIFSAGSGGKIRGTILAAMG